MNLPRESACVYVLQLNLNSPQLRTSDDFNFCFCHFVIMPSAIVNAS
jgi:hypothetical protein